MRRLGGTSTGLGRTLLLIGCATLSACMTMRPTSAPVPAPWKERAAKLQHARAWQLDGRAAVSVGTEGWQASLDWRQSGADTELHLAGPLGVGALVLKQTPDGLSLNNAPPSDAMLAQLQTRLGFDLPLHDLRYWLLGVPDPGSQFELARDDQDRAQQLMQAGWTVAYERYMAVGGDWLPARLVLTCPGVRVRVVVDRWQGLR